MSSSSTRQITGVLLKPDAAPFANSSITVYRDKREVVPQGNAAIVDEVLRTVTGPGGEVSMALVPGRYLGQIQLSDADRYFQFAVPDGAGPFLIQDLIGTSPVNGAQYLTFVDLVVAARAWAENPEDAEVIEGEGAYSALHWAAKAEEHAQSASEDGSAAVAHAQEWAQSPDPISVDAGGDGTTDRSSKWWAAQAGSAADRAENAAATVEFPVSYGLPQSLTPEQQLQAQDNIGATRYAGAFPAISLMGRFRATGISPEDVDTGNEIANGADAAIPIRQMFGQGLADGINVFNFAAGQLYNMDSWDPADPTHALAVFLDGVTSDIIINAHGATIKGLNGIQESVANPGAMFRVVGSGASSRQRFVWNGGRVDMTELHPASSGVTTVGGLSLGGRLNIELRGIMFDHGITEPIGDAIGVGGGDQSVFCTNYESLLIDGCSFIGDPDLGVYLSNSQGKEARIVNSLFYRCQNGIAQKRFSKRTLVANCRFVECDTGIYNPYADGLTDNNGGAFYIKDCIFERIQTNPIDIGGSTAAGSKVQNCEFLGWKRRLSDGGEVSWSGVGFAVRIRVPNCIVSGCLFDMDGWPITTTPGKEQVGIQFGYTGGTVDTGANDCLSQGNVFKDVYRAHVMDANTARIKRADNKRVNVSSSDVDAGDNFLPYRLTDDTMVEIVPPQNRSRMILKSTTTGNGWPNGAVFLNTTGAPAVVDNGLQTMTNIALSNSVTNVSGAVDGDFTISAGIGVVRLINRTGGTKLVDVSWDQE